MQQPPRPPYRPPQPPPGRPAPGYGTPPAPPPQGYAPPHGYAPPPQQQAPVAPRRPKKRGALKFVASTCVLSAWLTLVISLIFAGVSLMAGLGMSASSAAARSNPYLQPSQTPSLGGTPGLGSGDGLGGLEGSGGFGGEAGGSSIPNPLKGLGDLIDFRGMMATACYASAAFNFLTGFAGFFLFLGLGQACYALLELEEESQRTNQWLEIIAARLGAR